MSLIYVERPFYKEFWCTVDILIFDNYFCQFSNLKAHLLICSPVNEFVLPADELSQKLETCVVSNSVLSMPSTTRKHRQFLTCFQIVKFEPSTSFNDIYLHILDQLQCATNSFMPFMFQMSHVLSQYCPSCAQVGRKGCVPAFNTLQWHLWVIYVLSFHSSKIWVIE